MRGFLGPPLIVLGKRLQPIRNVLVGHRLRRPAYGPGRVQISLAQHVASHIPRSNGTAPPNDTYSPGDGSTIPQTFIGAVHVFEGDDTLVYVRPSARLASGRLRLLRIFKNRGG
jgi:hypothetical protein